MRVPRTVRPRGRMTAGSSAALLVELVTTLTGACTWGSPGGMVVGSGDVTSQARTVAGFEYR